MTAENNDAATALAWGLIDVVAPEGGLDAAVERHSAKLCSNAVRKRCVRKKRCCANGKSCR
jgi:enoyl-CoA hydratase/carnithine racemase